MRRAPALMALALAGASAGCSEAGPSAQTIAAERAAVAADAAARASATAVAATNVTAAPAETAVSGQTAERSSRGSARIIRQSTRQGRIDPECVITVGYPDGTQHDRLVPLGSCEDLSLRLLPVARLVEIGQLDDLPEQARRDIMRSRGGVVLYTESEFTSSAYPQSEAGDCYEVPLAD